VNQDMKRAIPVLLGILVATATVRAELPDLSGATSNDLCRSFANKAAESRLARHKQELIDLKLKVEEQLLLLEVKTKQLELLTAKRDEMRAAVSTSLVKMYTNVEPDIAAQQLEKLGLEPASEILQRLNPKISGEIISAMDAKFASKVVKLMLVSTTGLNRKTEK
jgi:flagellar motility protein MotE (MotC chaperone)